MALLVFYPLTRIFFFTNDVYAPQNDWLVLTLGLTASTSLRISHLPSLNWADVSPPEWWSHHAPFNKSSHLGSRISDHQLGSVTANLEHTRPRRGSWIRDDSMRTVGDDVSIVQSGDCQHQLDSGWVLGRALKRLKRLPRPTRFIRVGPDKASMRERIIWILSTETRARLENAIAQEKVIIRLQLERIREVPLTKSTQRIPQSASHDSDIQCSVVRHGAVRLCRLIWRMDSVAVRTCVG